MIDNVAARISLVDTGQTRPAWSRGADLDTGGNRRMTSTSVSPDGHWLALGGWKDAGVRVWDLHRRRAEQLLRPDDAVGETSFVVRFSPDGEWLVSCTATDSGNRYHFWRTGTWELVRRIDQERNGIAFSPPAFTSDGRLMAMGIAPDQVLLADAATGREVARLTTLEAVTPTPLAFSPDRTKLVARTDRKTVLVWDLRRIRERLVAMELDWDAPGYPVIPANSVGILPKPRQVRVIGEVIETAKRHIAERAEMDRRLTENPDDAEALLHRAWLSRSEGRLGDAIVDLERRRRLQANPANDGGMLAECYLESGNLAAAFGITSQALDRSAADREARFLHGLLALALGRTSLAADEFDQLLATDPTDDVVRYHRVRTLNKLGRSREALSDLEGLITRNPGDFGLYHLRATAHEALGEQSQARLDQGAALSLQPKVADKLNNMARPLVTGPFRLRDPERSVALARQAVSLGPDQAHYLNTLGTALP